MNQALSPFNPLVREWFSARFGEPSPVQREGWPAIGKGVDTLLCAPTGSGKTLAAFLWAINRLVEASSRGELADEVTVVYVSPLKALANDIRLNLEEPLEGIRRLALQQGIAFPEIRVAVRTGDTPTTERTRMSRRPPHIVVTTPESLFIMLTSARFRRNLSRVRYVIVDELHAVAADKRGAHLAVTLERLERLVIRTGGIRPVRVGLSATLNPVERLGRFLCGGTLTPAGVYTPRPFQVVHADRANRRFELTVKAPGPPLGPIATHEHWEAMYDELASLIAGSRTTLVFTLSRRWAERIALNLQNRLGKDAVMAHHGSLGRAERLKAEQRLKRGELKAIVATASLELGIDVGAVDLVCQVDSPRSLSAAIQRIGRSGHRLGATARGCFFALTLDDLVESAAVVRAIRRGVTDEVELPRGCLDVAAQQIIAIAAEEGEIGDEELLRVLRGAVHFRNLTLAELRQLLADMARELPNRIRGTRPRIFYDPINRTVRPRRDARMAAITSGGTIPESGNYDVVIESEDRKIGDVEEDFAQESSRGDVFSLGSMPWQIRRISRGRLMVEAAPGMMPTLPFWQTEAAGRSLALSREVSQLRAEIAARMEQDGAEPTCRWLEEECALTPDAARQAVDYIRAGVAALGVTPGLEQLVVERFFDGLGGTQVVIHAPYGMRLNRGLGLALRKRICQSFDFEIQASATDDAILLALNSRHSFPLETVFSMITARTVAQALTQAVLNAPMFEIRFRHVATRALAILRHLNGQRVPAWIQRLRAQELASILFPEQQACFENRGPETQVPEQFLVREALRECLEESTDLPGLIRLLEKLEAGRIGVRFVESLSPSPFAQRLLLAWDYSFLDDGERANRRSRTVAMNRGLAEKLLSDSELATMLPAEAINKAISEATGTAPFCRARDADELHSLIRAHGWLAPEDVAARTSSDAAAMLSKLERAGRIARIIIAPGLKPVLVASEDLDLVRRAYSQCKVETARATSFGNHDGLREANPQAEDVTSARGEDRDSSPESALEELVHRALKTSGPVTERTLCQRLAVSETEVRRALLSLEARGAVFRGRFSSARQEQWCERYQLERIHRLALNSMRTEVEPAAEWQYVDFLLRWHHLGGANLLPGLDGLEAVVAQLRGLAFPVEAWEESIFPARLRDYRPELMDVLCAGGRVFWAGLPGSGEKAERPSRIAFFPQGTTPPWPRPPVPSDGDEARVFAALERGGAQFAWQLARITGLEESRVVALLWSLAVQGLVSNDSFSVLRAVPAAQGKTSRHRGSRKSPRGLTFQATFGRWSVIEFPSENGHDSPESQRDLAMKLLSRHGILTRASLELENLAIRWAELVPILRRLEYAGVVRRGYFVRALPGEQYALPEAVELLSAVRHIVDVAKEAVAFSAADPANPYGVSLPAVGVAREMANTIVIDRGRPIMAANRHQLSTFVPLSERDFSNAAMALVRFRRRLRLTTIDGIPALGAPRAAILSNLGFHSDGSALVFDGLPGPRPILENVQPLSRPGTPALKLVPVGGRSRLPVR